MENNTNNINMRPYAGEVDLEAIANLINFCDATYQLDQKTSVSELRDDFNTPSFDQESDICLWENIDKKLIGFGSLWITEPSDSIDGYLSIYVHPNLKNSALQSEIIRWGESRMRQVRQERGFEVKLRSRCRDSFSERIVTLKNRDFTIDRYFLRMERSLSEQIPQPDFPEGFTWRQTNPEQDVIKWMELFNDSFQDHWNHHDVTLENLQHWLKSENYRSDLDLIAVDSNGKFVACCYGEIFPEDNLHKEYKEGWISIVATRREFRRMGIGKAILLSNLHQLKAAGMDVAKLGVDADNPNGALGLYESIGFRKIYTTLCFVKDVSYEDV
ncbi:GNAT family N-acetyltransferase [Mastigocoleus testarum]|uniref:N-acetyltransferase domain-containing protein n=1 Tax=Mastigocoleus testarum BC008 TaxID=371196 RepID=A0A0V7ZER1_9CYAN|nr:GNAT family N-acetyltransferase [Mastigocoleus testarum]KST62840.1 hypothetical protein BC008_10985 [Mastigocoleus testarum BC008]KST62892.1 hypothetical protein BC008_11270 [Mastigocoleus testarum BC008]